MNPKTTEIAVTAFPLRWWRHPWRWIRGERLELQWRSRRASGGVSPRLEEVGNGWWRELEAE